MRPIGGFFYCFSCQPYKETNPACRGSWEHKHFLFLFSFFFFSLPLFFVFAFLMFIAIVQRSAEGQKVFTLKLMISTCRFVWRTTKSVLQSLYGSLLFTAVSDNTHPRKPRGSQSVLVKKQCLKNFVAPFLSARLAAPGSPRINNTWPAPSLEFKFFCDVNQTLKAWHFLADL